jgi:hypothetical protein
MRSCTLAHSSGEKRTNFLMVLTSFRGFRFPLDPGGLPAPGRGPPWVGLVIGHRLEFIAVVGNLVDDNLIAVITRVIGVKICD